jgi:hypothetical protein
LGRRLYRPNKIDASDTQRPKFPHGGRIHPGEAKRKVGGFGPPAKSSGPQYDGP